QASNRLCVLLGVPPRDLADIVGDGPIPSASRNVVVGIPAELILNQPCENPGANSLQRRR
ncbi:MAG: hypothetical protein ACPGXX_22460, partial [Planctomycetaceae bacterium]